MGFLIHGPGRTVKLYLSVPWNCKTVFLRPYRTCKTVFPDPRNSPPSPPRSSDLTPKTLAKIRACRPCIKNPTVGKHAKITRSSD